MFVRIDHVMICVPELNAGIGQYRALGFDMHPGGVHPGKGTHNAIAFNRDDYIELLAMHDRAEYEQASASLRRDDGVLPAFVAAGGGIRYVIIQSDGLEADIAAMRARGVEVSDVLAGSRRTIQGLELRWKAAVLGAANPLPLFFIEHLTPVEQRRSQIPGAVAHPNGVQHIERAYIVTPDATRTAAQYAKVLGMPQPALTKGTVIMSDMAVFQIGATGLGIAQPYAGGPAAEALARRGPGPFQALYRTSSMGAAAKWMQEHGLPSLPRGVRNTGEQAMLAPPDLAGGAYIGFVGPE
jgi:hypothetical protein